ncbi:MAG: DUF3825 domain-containing protein, partial [Proteobacteria bacterium]|nr:DUF3825 domain-containing protein [Pseudomonadota bacterium]
MNLHQEFCTPDYKLGYIDQFVEERGYGWIKDENGEQVFFHISDVLDINKAPINLKEKVCFFAVTSEKHGFDAKKINRKWDYGDIVYINDVESYGFINGIGKIKKKIHFHLDSFVNYPNSIPQKGQIVSFSSQIGDRGDSIALNVNAAEECFGEIIEWNENKGKILPTNSKNPVSLCEEDVIANQNAEKISFKIGEKVTFLFDAYKNNVFFVQSCGKLNFGVIVSVVIDKGLGYIRQGGGFEKSILFHFNSLANYPKSNPRVGQYVSFLSRVGDRGDYIALSVNMVEKCFGEVIEWGQSEFQGKILPTNSKDPISIHGKEVVVQREGAFISLEVGDTVSFLFGESEKKAILARKDLPFRKFAYNDDDEKMLQDLAEEALDEDWSYSNSSINDPYRILRNYLFYTFRRLEEEDVNSNSGEKKIQVVELEDKSNIAVF